MLDGWLDDWMDALMEAWKGEEMDDNDGKTAMTATATTTVQQCISWREDRYTPLG